MRTTHAHIPEYEQTPAHDSSSVSGPLSYTQESIWLLSQLSQSSGAAYNEVFAFRITGAVHLDLLEQALYRVIERHDALRTVFVTTETGLIALTQEQINPFMEVVDLRGDDSEDLDHRIAALLTNHLSRPFDLRACPLLRAIVLWVGEAEIIFGLAIHHLVTDGWSMELIFDEIHKHYVSLCTSHQLADLPPPNAQYRDYVRELRQAYEQGALNQKIEYWKQVLAPAPDLLKLPLDYPRPPTQTFNGATYTMRIPKATITAFTRRCHEACGSTEFMSLLSAYAVLLSRYTGQASITIGTTTLNRNNYRFLNVVGCFVNTIALLFNLDEQLTFRHLLEHVGHQTLEMLDYQEAPYPKVLEHLDIHRDPSYNPVFQTMLTVLGKKKVLKLGDSVTCEPFPLKRSGTKFELLVSISEYQDGIEFDAEFNTDLLHVDTIKRLMHHYQHLIERLTDNIDVPIFKVPLLFDAERNLIQHVWNNTYADYPATTVIDLIEYQAQQTPDAIAVEFNDHLLTYTALNHIANQVAHFLARNQQAESAPFIGVYMERSVEMVIALLAIVKAGYAYVPIDPEYPSDRIRFMIMDAELPLILTQEKYRSALQAFDTRILVLSDLDQFGDEETSDPARQLLPDSNVYMIYTSGSTGNPKGVINRHVSLFNRLYWMQSMYGLVPDDRVLQKTPFSFDVSVWEFFWPLMFGARIVVAEPGGHRDADYLKHLIQDKQVTTLHFVPSMLNVFLEEDGIAACCASLRRVFCSGEALTHQTVEQFFARIPCELHNLYGPTEAAIDVSYWPCTLDYPGSIVPIGKPIANIQLYVLDRFMEIQPIGVAGELWIGGVGLAKGYHKREELTQTCFIANPFSSDPMARLYKTGDLARYLPDGNIEYLGRIDNQVKIRGFRIELGEIEAAIRALPSVKDATVIVHETRTTKVLVAYVVVASDFEQQSAKHALRQQLPDFMVPQLFVEIQKMPISANGKLERRALPDPFAALQEQAHVCEAVSPEEDLLLKIWKNVFGMDEIGVESAFFKLGGDSILSIRIVAQLRERGYAVEVHEMFTHPTIRHLAQLLQTRHTDNKALAETPFCLVAAQDREHIPANAADAWPLTMLQSGMLYHSMMQQQTPIYHDIFSFDMAMEIRKEYLVEAFTQIIACHPQLRSAFDLNSFDQPYQVVYRDNVVPLSIVDITHLSRQEQDAAIQSWIDAEKQCDFDLEQPPLLRIHIQIRSQDTLNLTIAFHHAILDGWSFSLLLHEFRQVYRALLEGQALPPQQEQSLYSGYVKLEQQALSDPAQADFWRTIVGSMQAFQLPRANPGNATRQPVATVENVVPEQLASRLQALAGDLNMPLKSIFLAVHLRVLGCLANRTDVVSGLVSNGRPEVPGGEAMVGLFLNTLPFPIELMHESWQSLITRVFKLEQRLVAYRRFPIAEIQKWHQNQPLFDTIFNYTDFHLHGAGDDASAVKILKASYFEQTNYAGVLHVHRGYVTQELRLIFNYHPAYLSADLATEYMRVLMQAVIDVSANANDIPRDLHIDELSATLTTDLDQPLSQQSIDTAPKPSTSYAAPRNQLEEQLCDILSQVLSIETIGIHDHFLDLGMDSITAIRMVAKIKKLGVKLTLQDIFTYQTTSSLAAYIESGKTAHESSAAPVQAFELVDRGDHSFPPHIVDAYPATSMQVDMIRHSEVDWHQAVFHDVFSYRLALPLNEAWLKECLRRVLNRHEIFRTAFALEGYTVPLQLIFDQVEPQIEVFDERSFNAEQQQQRFDRWFEGEKHNRFVWDQPTLVRFYIHWWSQAGFTLTLSFHHSIMDGWSLSLCINQVIKEYIACLEQTPLPDPVLPALKYRDFVKVELESRRSPDSQSFWREKLKQFTYNALPRSSRLAQGARWSETKLSIDEATLEGLTGLSNRLGVSLKHTLLAAHLKGVIGVVCQETDILTGVFTNGRLEETGGEHVLGLFLNFLPFRQQIENQTWEQWIKETFENERECLPYRRYPLGAILEDTRQERIFETVFNYTRFTAYSDIVTTSEPQGKHNVLQDVRWFEHTNFTLLSNVGYDVQQARLVITLNADGRLLSQQQVAIIGERYQAAFDQILHDPTAPVMVTDAVSSERAAGEVVVRPIYS